MWFFLLYTLANTNTTTIQMRILLLLLFGPVLCFGQNTTEEMIKKYQLRDTLVVVVEKAQVYQTPGKIEKFTLNRGEVVYAVRRTVEHYLIFTLEDSYGYVSNKDVELLGGSYIDQGVSKRYKERMDQMQQEMARRDSLELVKYIATDSLPTVKRREMLAIEELLEVTKKNERNTRTIKNIMVGMTILSAGILIQAQLEYMDAKRQARRFNQ